MYISLHSSCNRRYLKSLVSKMIFPLPLAWAKRFGGAWWVRVRVRVRGMLANVPLTPLLAGQASVFTPPRRGSPEGEDEVSSIENLKMALCYQ